MIGINPMGKLCIEVLAMGILKVALLSGIALLATAPITPPVFQDVMTEERVPPHIDPVVTGQTISSEDREDWATQKKRYLECPECQASQPFPK